MSNESKVTRQGQDGVRPGREAMTGVYVGAAASATATALPAADISSHPRRGDGAEVHRGGGGTSPTASYYGLPILNEPVWEARDIAGYLFLGGLAGASAVVGAGAHVTGRHGLARISKLGACAAAALSLAALVHDLGRPTRFLNMLRVFKVTSPMNVGSWLLSGFAPAATVSALSELTGLAPGLGAAATAGAAILGPAVAAYTAALISNTAVPSWHEGYRHMPYVFVSSGAAAAAGLGLLAAPSTDCAPVQRLAVVAGPAEIVLTKRMERTMGLAGEPYHTGNAGTYMKVAQALTGFGSVAALFARRHRAAAVAAGSALLLGSAFERFGIFHAGVQSSKDPVYTVAPQRERLREQSEGE